MWKKMAELKENGMKDFYQFESWTNQKRSIAGPPTVMFTSASRQEVSSLVFRLRDDLVDSELLLDNVKVTCP